VTSRRILFTVPGRRGLGHVMRALNVAREVRRADPGAECLFAGRGDGLRTVVGDEFPVLATAPDDPRPPAVVAAARARPHVVVHDTAVPAAARVHDERAVYVMRRSLPQRQAEVLASPVLRDMALILVPHTAADFGYRVPADLADRCRFVGPIARRPDAAGARAARERYGAEGAFLLTSTVGGGGFRDQAEAFLETVAAAQRVLEPRLPRLRHVVLPGPNFSGVAPTVPGAVQTSFEPRLVDLLAASDLVVAEGGYNTVLEVRLAQVPAVFLPSVRSWDDQEQRVRALEARGLARVLTGRPPEEAALAVAAAATDEPWRARVRARYAGEHVQTGNRAAALALLELAGA
jgi:predicted glycosyltransferase